MINPYIPIMEKKTASILSFVFLVFGLSLLVNLQANITGAVIGLPKSPSPQGYSLGAIFILVSFTLFTIGIGGTEQKKNNKLIKK